MGSGKTALVDRLCKHRRDRFEIAVVTNDIYTKEDAELLLHLLARTDQKLDFQIRLILASRQLHGAFSALVLGTNGLQVLSDHHGFLPLVKCRYQGGTLIATETSAFSLFPDATDIEPISRGSTWTWRDGGLREVFYPQIEAWEEERACSFEKVYFSGPGSLLSEVETVQSLRQRLGRSLAVRESLVMRPDLVIPVPDAANAMALAYADQLRAPFDFAILRNHYADQTSLSSTHATKHFGLGMKFQIVPGSVTGKRITVVDDSLVRGDTARKLVTMLREAGAIEVHLRICSPQVVHDCQWANPTTSFDGIPKGPRTHEQLRDASGADSLLFQRLDDFQTVLGDPAGRRHCLTCFTGEHPLPPDDLLPASNLIRR